MAFHLLFWEVIFIMYLLLTPERNLFFDNNPDAWSISPEIFTAIISVCLSLIYTTIDFVFSYRLMRLFPIRFTLSFKILIYAITGMALVIIVGRRPFSFAAINSVDAFIKQLPQLTSVEVRFLIYYYFICFINNFFIESVKAIGKGNFRHWFFGLLNKPTEEERIFMFVDLRSSTTYAEQLGHKRFSHLVQDVFNDLAIVDNYGGDIYQYLGDGAIVSWTLKRGLKNNNFARAYHACAKMLEKRKRYYNRKYGIEPKFKAGAHVGKVMVLQVGQLKRDISYNGDILNTAARIESKCNELKQGFLISGTLYNMMENDGMFRFKNMGEMQLRGKKKAIEIWGVNPKPPAKK